MSVRAGRADAFSGARAASLTGRLRAALSAGGGAARLRSALGWSLLATALGQGATFLSAVVLANLLGREGFGRYTVVQSTLLTVAQMATLATGYTATRYVAELRSVDRLRAGRVMGLCAAASTVTAMLAAAGLALSAPWVAGALLREPSLAGALALVGAAVFFQVQNSYQSGVLAGLEEYRAMAAAGGVLGVGTVAGGAIGAWRGGLMGALAGLVAAHALYWVVLRVLTRRRCALHGVSPTFRGAWEERGILQRFAIPAAISGMVTVPSVWVANAFVARRPEGFGEMALFNASNSLRVLVLVLPVILNQVALSIISHQRGVGNEGGYRRMFWANMKLTAASVTVGALGLLALAPWLLGMFGAGFRAAYPVLAVLMLGTLAEALATAAYQVLQSHARIWHSFFLIVIPRAAILLGLAALLAPRGAVGLAWANAAAFAYALAATFLLARRLGLGLAPGSAPAGIRDTD